MVWISRREPALYELFKKNPSNNDKWQWQPVVSQKISIIVPRFAKTREQRRVSSVFTGGKAFDLLQDAMSVVCGPEMCVFHKAHIVYLSVCECAPRPVSHARCPLACFWQCPSECFVSVVSVHTPCVCMCVKCDSTGLASGLNRGGGVALVRGRLAVRRTVWWWNVCGWCIRTHTHTHTGTQTTHWRLAGTILATE